MTHLSPLCALADKYETDKGGLSTRYGGGDGDTCHVYTPAYHALFGNMRDKVMKVLEIGVNAGGSLRMWRDYFPNARIFGLDIRPEVMYREPGIITILADQGVPRSLMNAVEASGPEAFDLIVDDGSHELHHQITSMITLLPVLSSVGHYIIEDVGGMHCNPKPIQEVVPSAYEFRQINCGPGIGKAHCPACGGPEALFDIIWKR